MSWQRETLTLWYFKKSMRQVRLCWANAADGEPTFIQQILNVVYQALPDKKLDIVSTRRSPNAGSMLGQRCGRRTNNEPALRQRSQKISSDTMMSKSRAEL